MITVYIILGLIALCVVCVVIIGAQAKRVKKYKQENEYLLVEIDKAAWRVKRMGELLSKNNIVEETANAQRQELNNTADAGLASRANSLFGVRNKPDSGNSIEP
jgi:uncharacterized protein YoxC